MGALRLLLNSIVLLSILTVLVSVACFFGAQHILKLSNLTCFGLGAPSKVFTELQAAKDVAYVFDTSRLVFEQRTAYQEIEVYEHNYFGNILVIDGSLQITQLDEVNYHEMMVHIPLAYVPNAKKALVIGGGDGGALSRILHHQNIESAYLVDIDMHAMRNIAQIYFPQLYASFLDHRTKAFSYDGNQWVKEQLADPEMAGSVELIIVDSTDYGSAESLFTDAFYQSLSDLLHTDNGIMIINLDSPSWNLEICSIVQRQLAKIFKYSYVYHSQQPTFLSGHYSYLFASNNVNPMKTPIDWKAWDEKSIYTYYYSPDLHYASFMLPAAQRKTFSMAGQLKDVPPENFYQNQLEQETWPEVDIPANRFPQPDDSSSDEEGADL